MACFIIRRKPNMMMLMTLLMTMLVSGLGAGYAQGQPSSVSTCNRSEARAPLIPYPRRVTWSGDTVSLADVRCTLPSSEDESLKVTVAILNSALDHAGCRRGPEGAQGVTEVTLRLAAVPNTRAHPEAYALEVTSGNGVRITAPEPAGLFYGVQTLRQLIQQDPGTGPQIPACDITDWPAFRWRGFMHDLGRNYQEPDLLRRFIDVMAAYKLNVFHMHLTDRPGYRIESIVHPELNDPKNYRSTRSPGKFYSYAELNEIIAYCRVRNIRVVPEIDMPGHSDYFPQTFGVDMQSDEGMDILTELLDEFFTHVNLPTFHMGSDEVRVHNPAFIPRMDAYLRGKGKEIIVWRPGHLPEKPVITQLWTGGARPAPGLRYLDSQANYVNHMDPLVGPVRVFMQQPCRVPEATDLALGGILCHWPDNNVGEPMNVYRQSPVLPALVTYAERIWRGADHNRPDAWARLPAAGDPAFQEFASFESDLIHHRDRFFTDWPFPYVRQTQVRWRIIGPFDHGGDTTLSFPVEEAIHEAYEVNGETFGWRDEVCGGTVHINHFFGFPGHLPKSEPGTVYALTYIHSPREGAVPFWIGFNENSRAGGRRSGPNPAQGQWSIAYGKVWINDQEIPPPVWRQPGLGKKTPEVPFVDELYVTREPTLVHLKQGWNKVLVKCPHSQAAWKWMFTCIPAHWDGTRAREVPGLRFAPRPEE